MDVSIARRPVKKNIATVNLVFIQIQFPSVGIIIYQETGSPFTAGAGSLRQKVTHQSRLPSISGLSKLNLHQNLVTAGIDAFWEESLEAEPERGRIGERHIGEINRNGRDAS